MVMEDHPAITARAQYGKPSLVCDMMEPWRAMVEAFILKYHTKLDRDNFTLHGNRSFLKQQPMHSFTKALDKHIDNKRTPYNYRDNSKTTRIRTAIKEDPKKLAMKHRKLINDVNTKSAKH